jgi:dCMP deaminase
MGMNAHKDKYHDLYWDMAHSAAKQSQATRRKVGAVIVAPTGMISIGWNGMPAGFDNECEVTLQGGTTGHLRPTKETKPEVIHVERNAIDKMTNEGVPIKGSILFVTLSPCLECAKSIHGLGFKHIYYREAYRCTQGVDFLKKANVPTTFTGENTEERYLMSS